LGPRPYGSLFSVVPVSVAIHPVNQSITSLSSFVRHHPPSAGSDRLINHHTTASIDRRRTTFDSLVEPSAISEEKKTDTFFLQKVKSQTSLLEYCRGLSFVSLHSCLQSSFEFPLDLISIRPALTAKPCGYTQLPIHPSSIT
jgi:hypothetical protein